MRFGTRNVRNMCRLGSLTIVARELVRHKLDFVDVQVRWDIGYFFLWKRKQESSIGNRMFCTSQNSINS
jgi:hypothetical protein